MFENLTLPHLLMVLVIAMLLFGTKRIPEIAGSMGKGIREFKKNISEVGNDTPRAPLEEERNQLSAAAEPNASTSSEVRTEPKRLL